MKKVLITGMSGLIGGLLRAHLEDVGGYELTALNRRPVDGVTSVQADISDLDAIMPAFQGQDVVVHLAAHLGDDPWESVERVNLKGTYNVYEAARLAGVRRVVFASSGATIRGYDRVSPYDALTSGRYEDAPKSCSMITHEMTRPAGLYGVSKVWGEALGRHYSDAHGLSIICVRIGSVPRENRPRTRREYSVYLSHRDVAEMLYLCIEAPDDLKYDIFFATSNKRWGFRDLEHPREVIGYVAQDSADVFE